MVCKGIDLIYLFTNLCNIFFTTNSVKQSGGPKYQYSWLPGMPWNYDWSNLL